MGKNDVGGERDQFGSVFAIIVGIAAAPAVIDPDVLADGPTQLLETKRREAGLAFRIVSRGSRQHADAPHSLALLRTGHRRPRRRTAEQRDEVAPLHVWMAPAWQEIFGRAAQQRSLAVMCPAC
jgi:hypothetical protein